MNSGIGELLREGIECAAAGERFHPGLTARARQRHHRRTITVRAAAVTGTTAVAAVAVFAATAGSGGGAQPGGQLPAQTTAYVVGHTERALAVVERGNLIERVTATPARSVPSSEVFALVVPTGRHGNVRRLSSLKIIQTTTWSYRGRTRTQGFAPGGRLAIDLGPSTPARPSGPQPPARIIAVDPNAGQWYHPLRNPPFFHLGPLTCTNQGADWLAAGGGGETPAQLTTLISKALSCGLFRADGHQVVDGVDALRLAATPPLLRQLRGEARDIGTGVTLWVNAKTFRPVRLVLSPAEHTDFGWLKPTPANLATLRVTVPAGLREVRLPAGATVAWAVGAGRNR
jgi:hypothetical protein